MTSNDAHAGSALPVSLKLMCVKCACIRALHTQTSQAFDAGGASGHDTVHAPPARTRAYYNAMVH
eukprot:659248-Pleurochrysis_carterae.AAC.1